ncbi:MULTISPECIES: hypothetical protein [Bradyrhizobium]|uniref:hypothetical protein n=1 Tax=Bradyrhizobium TaxID=374 RepID=UPI001FE681F9|nr:hypothetical protein [Bradyrhizobium liaoningense]GMP03497.1 hypothetical protein TM239_35230 [Bradyrhizobium sp. TM239]
MKRLMLSLIAALFLAGTATGVLRSHALLHFGQSGMPSIQDMQTAQSGKLPEQEMQDRSVLFAREPAQ